MLRNLFVSILSVLALGALLSSSAHAQAITTHTFATLPGSPTAGQLAWLTDNSGSPTEGSPAAGGAAPGNRDLIAYDATQTRWEFVFRVPATAPEAGLEKFLAANRIDYDNTESGATAEDVQAALDELFASPGGGGGDLGTTATGAALTITNTGGTPASIPAATSTTWGALTDEDKLKLDGIAAGATAGLGDHVATQDVNLGLFEIDSLMGSPSASRSFPLFAITNPATTTMGSGVTWGTDQVAKAYPGGPEIDTRNHLLGWFYNKTGVNGNVVSTCDPAWDWSHETNFRTTAATADDAWPELNFDKFTPDFTTVPTGVTGTFAPGDYLTFSGGGTGKVVSFSGGTLTFVHTTSPCPANGQTITNVSQAGGGTVASLTSLQTRFRGLQFEWDVPDYEVRWTFSTRSFTDSGPSTLRIRDEAVGINYPDPLTRRLAVWNNVALFGTVLFEYDGAGTSGQNGNVDVVELKADFGSLANTHFNSALLTLLQPVGGAAATINQHMPFTIEDQRGWGSSISSIQYIFSQTCNGSACATGDKNNIYHAGFGWNTGHFVAGAASSTGDHFYRGSDERWHTTTNANPTSGTSGPAIAEMAALNGTAALGTALIASGACASVVTVAATGIATTDVVSWGFNGDVSGVDGYRPLTTGALSIYAYPTAGNVNFKVCNPTASSITPGAVTLNWNVVR